MNVLSVIFYITLPIMIFIVGIVFDKTIKNKKLSRILQISVLSFLIAFIIGFRSLSVGNDTTSYCKYYLDMRDLTFSEAMNLKNFETGYLFVTYVFAKIGIPFFLFNFLVSLLLSVFLVLSCYSLSKYPALSVSIYICSGCFTLNMSSVRQTLAMSLCFASVFLLAIAKGKKSFFKMLALIPWCLSIFIHKSSALFAIAILCMFIEPKKTYYVFYFMLFSLIVILFMPVISTEILFNYMKSTEVYSFFPPRSSLSFSGTALMLYFLVATYFVIYSNEKYKINLSFEKVGFLDKLNGSLVKNDSLYFNDRIVAGMMMFQYIMYLGDQTVSLLARAGFYGSLGMCIYIPNVLVKTSKEEKTNPILMFGVLLFFVAYFAFTTLKDNYLNLIPYGVF